MHPKVYVSPDKGFRKSPKFADVDTHIQAAGSKRRNENEERSVLTSGLSEQMEADADAFADIKTEGGSKLSELVQKYTQDEVRRYERAGRCQIESHASFVN